MRKRTLGKNHLEISSIGLGCWGMSHAYGKADEKESIATINYCLDLGINFLDTADVYGDGHNERLIAKVLKKRRQEAVVGTKFGFAGDEDGNVRVNGRPDYVQSACEKSLQRLNIDVIDLYYFHRLDPEVPIEETVGAMADLVRQGKVLYLGLSEVSAATIKKASTVHPITALQSEYSLWHRNVEENILPTCLDLNISLVPFSPLGRGFLTGAIKSPGDLRKNDYRRMIPRFDYVAMGKNLSIVNKLQQLAKKNDVSPSQLSLAWLLAQDDSIVPIPGMKQRKYIGENLASVDISLPDEVITELNTMELDVQGGRHNKFNLQFVEE
ncbi:aldo/keto reductase [Desulfobacula sp.]|uniref:aldo/keto reductase n=1 Tax=Desulfobacula sp. TaxID=2593537 RepID=UPI00262AC9CA|nr:aldo/keto reductase [Desulfobacula sp.]